VIGTAFLLGKTKLLIKKMYLRSVKFSLFSLCFQI
jgi:hypothetical protein